VEQTKIDLSQHLDGMSAIEVAALREQLNRARTQVAALLYEHAELQTQTSQLEQELAQLREYPNRLPPYHLFGYDPSYDMDGRHNGMDDYRGRFATPEQAKGWFAEHQRELGMSCAEIAVTRRSDGQLVVVSALRPGQSWIDSPQGVDYAAEVIRELAQLQPHGR
jgi:hypothetical protein